MNKFIFIILISILTLSIPFQIPTEYYSQECSISENTTLHKYLEDIEWIDNYEYSKWDCSQMSVYMEYYLENCGYNTIICLNHGKNGTCGHVYLLVEIEDNEWLAYESTGLYWVYPNAEIALKYNSITNIKPEYYNPDKQFNNIYTLWYYYFLYGGRFIFSDEFGWYNKYELLENTTYIPQSTTNHLLIPINITLPENFMLYHVNQSYNLINEEITK